MHTLKSSVKQQTPSEVLIQHWKTLQSPQKNARLFIVLFVRELEFIFQPEDGLQNDK